jgi:protein-disulfide isomerase/uncharacterized membrane protein
LAPLLALAGFGLSAYLTALHHRLLVGDLSLGAACSAVAGGDCHSVVASPWGTLLGLPVSAFGMAYYAVAGTLSLAIALLRREDTPAFVAGLVGLVAAALAADAWLGLAMWRIGRLCVLCAATYAINLALFAIALRCRARIAGAPARVGDLLPSVRILARPADPLYYREALKLFLALLALGGIAAPLGQSLLASRSAEERERSQVEGLLAYLRRVEPLDVATDGQPARGPEDAPLTLVVFLDFLCEQCRLASRYLDIVAASRADTLRIATRNFPVDARCNELAKGEGRDLHPGACWLAQGAECAHRLGRYWAFHDAVFAGDEAVRPESVAEYAARAGLDPAEFDACLGDERIRAAVEADIAAARALGVSATPTTFLDGRPVVGALKPSLLEAALAAIAEVPRR